jgi:sulfate transport system permease protein
LSATTSPPNAARGGPKIRWRQPSILPGFGPSLAVTLIWLGIIVILPLGVMLWFTAGLGWAGFFGVILKPRVMGDLFVSLWTAFAASFANIFFGLLVAWVLTRYQFFGRRLADALVDLPFALPTAVAGIALSTLYAPHGWVGAALAPLGITIAFTPAGIVVAMIFISLPFIVRTVQPVIQDLEVEQEEAASLMGATPLQIFWRISLPAILPSLLTGFALAFARCLGEYGSIIFIAGNKPMISEIVPLLIVAQLDQFDYQGATAIGTMMLAVSFVLLLAINLLQAWVRKRHGG